MRGFLNEIKNVAINQINNRISNMVSDALGGGRKTNPGGRGGIDRSSYATLTPFRGKHVAYPEDLGTNDQGHYVVFHINEQQNANVKFSQGRGLKTPAKYGDEELANLEPGGIGASGSGRTASSGRIRYAERATTGTTVSVPTNATKRLEASIAMYMPATVSVAQQSQYGEVEMGILATAAANLYKTSGYTGVFNKEFLNSVVNEAGGAISDGGEVVLKKAADTIAPGAKAAIELASGKVTNNRLEMVFQGLGRRTFSYSFKMMPKSEAEANQVDQICRMFRFYMAPSFDGDIGSSRTMIVPATFDITYMNMNIENGYLNKISTCVLESCNVTYGGERVQFFRPNQDGAPPVETNIELQFRELELITREKLALGY